MDTVLYMQQRGLVYLFQLVNHVYLVQDVYSSSFTVV